MKAKKYLKIAGVVFLSLIALALAMSFMPMLMMAQYYLQMLTSVLVTVVIFLIVLKALLLALKVLRGEQIQVKIPSFIFRLFQKRKTAQTKKNKKEV